MERTDKKSSVETCPKRAPSKQMEPSVFNADHTALIKPMQEITVDYTEHTGKNFINIVDCFSSCTFCEETKDKTIASTMKVMKAWFDH